MVRKTVTVECDRGYAGCQGALTLNVLNTSEGREIAQSKGWTRVQSHDLCENCTTTMQLRKAGKLPLGSLARNLEENAEKAAAPKGAVS